MDGEADLVSMASDQLDLDTDEERKRKEEEFKRAEETLGPLKKFIEDVLKEQVKDVRYSDRLTESPVCLVSQSHDPSARRERFMEAMGKSGVKSKRILEINPKHPVFEKINRLSKPQKAEWVEVLYNQALLTEGSTPKDPTKFSKQIANLMVIALQ